MAYDFTTASSQDLRTASTPVTGVPLTLACWFDLDGVANDQALVCIADKDVDTEACYLSMQGASASDIVSAIARDGGTLGIAGAASSYVSGWAHAAGVFTTTTSRTAYFNGVAGTPETTAVTPTGLDTIAVGVLARFSPAVYADGRIAEVGIWNAALTAAEVASLARGYSPSFVRPQSLVFYAPLVRALVDLKGGLTITNTNGAVVAAHTRVFYPKKRQPYSVAAAAAASAFPWHYYQQQRRQAA